MGNAPVILDDVDDRGAGVLEIMHQQHSDLPSYQARLRRIEGRRKLKDPPLDRPRAASRQHQPASAAGRRVCNFRPPQPCNFHPPLTVAAQMPYDTFIEMSLTATKESGAAL